MVDETVNTQSSEEEYEYEYIELAEGEELPADADYEYEYIEVPVESVPHEEAVSEPVIENVSAPVEPVPAVTAEPEPTPTEAAPVAASEPEVVSEPVSTPQEAVAAQSVSPTVAESETLPVENVVSAEEEAVWEVVPEMQVTEVSETVVETVAMAESAPVAEMVAAESEPEVNVAVPNSSVPVSEEVSNTEALPEDDNSLLELSQNEESLSEMLVDVSASGNVVLPTVETDVDLESELFGASAPVNIDEIPFNEAKTPAFEAASPAEVAPIAAPEPEVVPESVAMAGSEPVPEEAAPVAVSESEVVFEPVAMAEPEPVPAVVPEPVAMAEPEPAPAEVAPIAAPEPEVVPESVAMAGPEPVPEEAAPVAVSESEVVFEPVAMAEPEPVPEEAAPVAVSESEVVSELVAVAEPEPTDLSVDETEIEVIQNILSGEQEEKTEPVVQEDVSMVETTAVPVIEVVQETETSVIETINPEEVKADLPKEKQEEPIIETISAPVVMVEEVSPAEEGQAGLSEPEIFSEEVSFQVLPLTDEKYLSCREKAKTFGRMSGVQTFNGDDECQAILLDEVDYKEKELESWSVVVFKTSLVSLPDGSSSVRLEKNSETIRYARVVKNGSPELLVFNEDEFNLNRNDSEFVQGKNHFIYAKPGLNTGLIVNDFENISLADKEGKTVVFSVPVSGLLTGPGNAKLYFANVREVVVPTAALVRMDEDKLQAKNAKWYSGSLSDKYFELSAGSSSCEFIGNEEVKNIHVNVGTSTYGWNVTFDNGIVMSFRDLQEFQNKHGALPSANGVIFHGQLSCKFNNIERIVVYEIPQYFAYGRM